MQFPDYFAEAEASFKQAAYIIVGVPYEKTSSFRPGTAQGPQAIRQASWNFESFDLRTKVDLSEIPFHDYGNLAVEHKSPSDMVQAVTACATQIVQQNKFPIFIGGEHSATPGIIKAFSQEITVLSLDAHLDYRNIYENEVHNHACAVHRITDSVDIQNIAVLGIRSAEKAEYHNAEHDGLFFCDAFTLKKQGIASVLKKVNTYLPDKPLYLTCDIDVLDPAYAPGTSTPEPFGLHPLDVLSCIDFFADRLIGFDIMEVSPRFDHGETALLAAKFIRSMIATRHKIQQ